MKDILIDTNVVLDFSLQRQEFGEDAKNLLIFISKNKIKAFITASSITDIYYVLRKAKGHNDAINFLKSFITIIKVLGVDDEIIINALHSKMNDFEDAVQTQTAITNNIEIIITRNKIDFENSGLQIYNPKEFLGKI